MVLGIYSLTRYLKAAPPAMNQNATIRADIPNNNTQVLHSHELSRPFQKTKKIFNIQHISPSPPKGEQEEHR